MNRTCYLLQLRVSATFFLYKMPSHYSFCLSRQNPFATFPFNEIRGEIELYFFIHFFKFEFQLRSSLSS